MPRLGARFVDGSGRLTPEWRDYLLRLFSAGDAATLEAQLVRLADRVQDLETATGDGLAITGPSSVSVQGSVADGYVTITLANDNQIPGPEMVYGTDSNGAKGWRAMPPATPILPVVTGEIESGQPVFVYADDGSLIYTEVA